MAKGPEITRGKKWAKILVSQGWWVEKLPASSLSGVPDWLQGRPDCGVIFTEAKTYEKVKIKGTPRSACTRAQQFFLDQVVRNGGYATILIVGEDHWVEHDWASIDVVGDWWSEIEWESYDIP